MEETTLIKMWNWRRAKEQGWTIIRYLHWENSWNY